MSMAARNQLPLNILKKVTFMRADSFHHQTEKEMRSKKNVYSDDFEKIIESKGCKLLMTKGDF